MRASSRLLTPLQVLNSAPSLPVLMLARPTFPSLRRLSFSDPHFGDNPVCHLCNYQTYVIYHLTQLTSLDAEGISDESKQLAMAIYLKKKMYYNMRGQ